MIIPFPETLTAENWQKLKLSGTLKFGKPDNGVRLVGWELNGFETVLTVDLINRTIEIPDDADGELVTILQTALARFGQPALDLTIYSQIKTLAQSAVGVAIKDLTAAQRNALIAVLLWDNKAIDNEGKVRPLGEWVRRRRE